MDFAYIIAGFFVGAIVGLTGVGGGSLMTPLLVLMFGIHPSVAVGTDLLYAAITKAGGTLAHGLKGSVDWKITRLLATGSLPPPAAPRHFRVGTNLYVARSLGIVLDDANLLRERLERSEGGP